jgi:two-component system sensor histidine kinase QseC
MKKTKEPHSLQSRLLLLLLSVLTVVWLGAAVMTWVDASHELDELLDGHLAQAAALLVVQQTRTEDDDGVADAPSLHKYAPKVSFQVFHEGALVMRSANVGSTPLAGTSQGFSTVVLGDKQQWRVFAARGAERDVQVFVAEQIDSRQSILWAVLRSVLLPFLYALPLLAVAVWWAVRQGLAPLRGLSRHLAGRQPQALEPLPATNLPAEMQPLVRALNGLFERIQSLIESERRFTADAAHELRTPIAAIRAQAQVALGAGPDEAQRNHALHATLAGCDRATRLVEQLLMLARLEAAPEPAPPLATVNLSALAQRLAADLAPAALARHQTLALEAPDVCPVAANELLLGVLVRNLLDNALRYSPDGAQVLVQVGLEGGQVVLQVKDSGPGLSEAEMARLGERFYRVLGSGQSGSGLGWSIVQRIAEVLGAHVQVSRCADLGGLQVSVRWPGST